MEISTRRGDDGTTGLFYGGRVPKDSDRPRAYGAVDEAQAGLGLARAATEPGGELDGYLVEICRQLYVVMGELATAPENRHKLEAGVSLASAEMVERLEEIGSGLSGRFEMPRQFVIPGQNDVSARLEMARTLVRRAERECLAVADPDSHVVPYLNRLSDLIWVMARWQEGESLLTDPDTDRRWSTGKGAGTA
ncbi:MAG TPA: cob(I)yrinic acid a,c-diamide adenosyltransferase [Acidimicrobiales bacterium]|nr:cob(I)yrinic acid a,c-diamide adenosyltransferase [Acidimicrobiales bacterium]